MLESPLDPHDDGALARVVCPLCRTPVWAGMQPPPGGGEAALVGHTCPPTVDVAVEVLDADGEVALVDLQAVAAAPPPPAEPLSVGVAGWGGWLDHDAADSDTGGGDGLADEVGGGEELGEGGAVVTDELVPLPGGQLSAPRYVVDTLPALA